MDQLWAFDTPVDVTERRGFVVIQPDRRTIAFAERQPAPSLDATVTLLRCE